jgi:hypothetical protein
MCEESKSQEEAVLDWWKRTNGLHTQESWVTNYRAHSGPWPALLSIHGVPEVESRLRNKVEKYAMYAAFILSGTIGITANPPGNLLVCSDDSFGGVKYCTVIKYAYLICMYASMIKFMECIMLSMAFVNALNETARDCDVYRMFSRGQGYDATVKVERDFLYGVGFNFLAVMLAGSTYTTGVAPGVFICFCLYVFREYKTISHRLFATASVQHYWRPEKGGKPDAGDPYDLEVPMVSFKERAEDGKLLASRLRNEILENQETRRHAPGLKRMVEKISGMNAQYDEQYGYGANNAKTDSASTKFRFSLRPSKTVVPTAKPASADQTDEMV